MQRDNDALLRMYEDIEGRIKLAEDRKSRLEYSLEVERKNLREKLEELQERGLEFSNVSSLQQILNEKKQELEEILTSVDRKLKDAGF